MLERDAIEHQRDADAADERGVVLADEDHGAPPKEGDAGMAAERGQARGTPLADARRKEHVQIARRRRREAQWPFGEGMQQSGEAQMNKAVEERQEAQVVFEYSRDPMFRSTHADGFIGGLTPNGQVHIAFFKRAPVLPKRHVFRLNPDGSLGAEVAEREGRQRIDQRATCRSTSS